MAAQVRVARLKAVTSNCTMRVRFNCPAPGLYRVVEVVNNAAIDNAADRCSSTTYPYPDPNPAALPDLDEPVMVLRGGIAFGGVQDLDIAPTGRVTALTGALPATIGVTDSYGEIQNVVVSATGAFRCHDPGRSSIRSDTGVTLIEVLIATVILVVGLVAGAQLLAISIQMHQLAAETTDATRLANNKLEELMKLNFAADPAIQITPVGLDPLTQNVPNYFDVPVAGVYTRRWLVQAGPTATTRFVTVRLVPAQTDRRVAKEVDLTTVVRQW